MFDILLHLFRSPVSKLLKGWSVVMQDNGMIRVEEMLVVSTAVVAMLGGLAVILLG